MPYNPYTQQGGIQPIPDPGGPQPSYTLTQNVSMLDQARHWIQQKLGLTPSKAAFLALHPEGLAAYGIGKAAWEGIKWMGQHSVPTDPYGTIQNMDWMNNDPSDPFGYQGISQGTQGNMANALEDRIASRIEDNLPGGGSIGRSWDGTGGPQAGSYGSFGPGGMSSYLLPVAGGGPSIPVIEGPKYTGAPYNPHAFENYYQNGDESWWDQYQNYPWQHSGQPGAPGPLSSPVPGLGTPHDPNAHITGQRGDTLNGPRNDTLQPTGGWGGGYGTGPDWSGVNVYYY